MEEKASWKSENNYTGQEILRFYETRRLITVFTRPRRCPLSWNSLVQSTAFNPISLLLFLFCMLLIRESDLFSISYPTAELWVVDYFKSLSAAKLYSVER
jgi:hypothetical protein